MARTKSEKIVEKFGLFAHILPMTEADLREFLAAMERLRAENLASPEKARRFLIEEGVLTEDGELAVRYKPAP